MGLPFEPETDQALAQRFIAALAPDYDVTEVAAHPEGSPGKFRKHVFDFNDGIRMIASIDRWSVGERKLHLSFSLEDQAPAAPGAPTLAWFMDRVRELCFQFGSGQPPLDMHRTRVAVHFWFEPPRKE